MASNGTTCRRRTPDHPPYALMIGTAIRSLAEEGGSTEESISRFIRSHYASIPPAHDLLLPYYLHRLTARAEFLVSAPGRYLVPPHLQDEEGNDPQPPQLPQPEEEEEEEENDRQPPQLPQPEEEEEEEENDPQPPQLPQPEEEEEEENDPQPPQLPQPEEEEEEGNYPQTPQLPQPEEEGEEGSDPQPPQLPQPEEEEEEGSDPQPPQLPQPEEEEEEGNDLQLPHSEEEEEPQPEEKEEPQQPQPEEEEEPQPEEKEEPQQPQPEEEEEPQLGEEPQLPQPEEEPQLPQPEEVEESQLPQPVEELLLPQSEKEEENKRSDHGGPTAEQKGGEDNANIEEGLPFVCKGDLVMELQPSASSPARQKPVEVPMRKRGRPKKKKKMLSKTIGLPESSGDLMVSATATFPVALEPDTLEPDTGPRKRGRKRKEKNDMSTESVGLAESGGCGSLVPTVASESMAPECIYLEADNEADEPDNRLRKRGRPPKKNDVSCLAESGGCGSLGLTIASESMAPECINLEADNEADEPENRLRKRGRPPKKNDVSCLAKSDGCGSLGPTIASESMAPECIDLEADNEADEPDNRPRKRGRPPKKNDVSCLAESGSCGLSVSTIVSESVDPERNHLEADNEGGEPDNRPRKRGRPPKKNDVSCLAESGGCGLSVSTFVSESVSVAPEHNNLEPNNEGEEPDNRPRKRGRPPKKKKKNTFPETIVRKRGRPPKKKRKKKNTSPETIVPVESGGCCLPVSSQLPSVPVALGNENVEKERNNPDTMPKRLGRPPKSKPMLAANETPTTSKCEPESVSATAEKSSGKPSGRPPNSGEKPDNGEPESAGATAEKKMGKRLGRPPKNSGKDTGNSEPGGTTAEKSTVERRGRPRKTHPESTGATTEKKTGKRLGRPPKNSGEKKDEGEPESVMATAEESTGKRRGRPPKTKTDNGEPVLATMKHLGRPPKDSGEKTMEEKTGEQKPDDLIVELEDLSSF